MANGSEPRDIERACFTIDGFRARFGHWPTLLRPGDCERLTSRVSLIADEEAGIRVEDDAGNQFSYAGCEIDDLTDGPPTIIWLRDGPAKTDL